MKPPPINLRRDLATNPRRNLKTAVSYGWGRLCNSLNTWRYTANLKWVLVSPSFDNGRECGHLRLIFSAKIVELQTVKSRTPEYWLGTASSISSTECHPS